MGGITSVEVRESLEELAVHLKQAKTLKEKERLQVLYWLKQENPPSILMLASLHGTCSIKRLGNIATRCKLG